MENHSKKPLNYYSLSRSEILEYIPTDAKKLIEFGCGQGNFSELLARERSLEFWGIEINPDAAYHASQKLYRVLCGDAIELLDQLPNKYFDCVVFNDMLEHLADPYSLLLKLKTKLSPFGVVVASIPKVRYWNVIKKLVLKGEWTYTDKGVLDRTHLRFFTRKSIIMMFNDLGYIVIKINGINSTKSKNFKLFNFFTFGLLNDFKFSQFACLAKIADNEKLKND